MIENTTLNLTHSLFQLMKQFPRPKLKQSSISKLTRSEQELLMILALTLNEDKKAITVTEISNLLQIQPAGVTHLINPLEKEGYIERLPAANDRRIVLIGLTENGRQKANGFMEEVQEQLVGLINHLGEEDSKKLIDLMSRMVAYFAS